MLINWFRTQWIKWAALIGAVSLVLLRVRKSGKDAERLVNTGKELERTEAQLHEIKRHQEIINRTSGTSRDDVIDSLRKGDY